MYPAHDSRRDAIPPPVSERSHGSVHKLSLLVLLLPFENISFSNINLYFEWSKSVLPLQGTASARRAARRRALTSITFTLLTISRLCLNCHTGWNLVLKGQNSLHSVSQGRSFQSHPSLRTWFRGRCRPRHRKQQMGMNAEISEILEISVVPQESRTVPAVS